MRLQFLRDLEKQMLKDLQEDKALKARFIKDPVSVLKERYNINIPDNIKLTVHQDSANEKHIVLPDDQEPFKGW